MYKRSFILMVTLALLAALVGLSLAASKGNYRKGKYLFRKHCRVCHAPGKAAKELSPASKLQADWQKAFRTQQIAGYQCKDKFAQRSAKDLKDIYSYLHKFAKDSPTPLKCK